jgi:hypothetical protein
VTAGCSTKDAPRRIFMNVQTGLKGGNEDGMIVWGD